MNHFALAELMDVFPESLQLDVKRALLALADFGVTTSDQLMRFVTDRTNPVELRQSGSWLMSRIRNRRSVETLIALLDCEDEAVALQATSSLGLLEDRSAVPALVTALKTADEKRRRIAAHALGQMGFQDALEPLLVASTADNSIDVQCYALEALGRLGAASVVPHILPRLKDPNPRIRYWATYTLGQAGTEEDVDRLEMLLTDDAVGEYDESVSQEAERAIEAIRLRSDD